jgi:adenosylhomocysteine nucleosidase
MIAIIAALPREIIGLVHGTRPDVSLVKRGIHLHRLPNAIVVAAGMGAERATVAVEAAMRTQQVTEFISAGLAGACSAQLAAGAVSEASRVIDVSTGERYAAGTENGVVLATTDSIAGTQEKMRLAASYSAAMVDMEAATVARLALAHGLPFRAIKGISDAHDFDFGWESTAPFADKYGHFRTAAFALYIALRPHYWGKAVKLGQNSNLALSRLHERLRGLIS